LKSGFVSFIGRPNAGKSTLLNRLVGAKLAIVSDKPQTTRNRILGVKNYPGEVSGGKGPPGNEANEANEASEAAPERAAQVVFLDTPGIHRPLHRMNVRMVNTAVDTIGEVDVLGLVVDAPEAGGKGDDFVVDLVKRSRGTVFLILNKIDLMKRSRLLPIIDAYRGKADFAEIVPISAATGENVDRLERAIIERLPEGEALYPADYLTDQPERFFAGEIVREKLLQFTRAEIPFSSAVVIDRFEEPDATTPDAKDRGRAPGAIDRGRAPGGTSPGLLKLYCTIVVDRESQKPIVLGRGGDMIRRIGTAAREDLERFFGTRVFLDLHVRVKSDWREDERLLTDFGL
jgi:GTP-binding protein Era